ncbi:MAG: hypothetical protein ACRD30_00480 [Bryobacteraceae bacterium]
MEDFDSNRYGPSVARLLALDGNGTRAMPLTCGEAVVSTEVREALKAAMSTVLFPDTDHWDAAMAGLWLYFYAFEEAHALVAGSETAECALWHAILHRQEPDSGNAAYWFRKAGSHPVFSKLSRAAARILERIPEAEFGAGRWDPFAFIAFCERARMQPGSRQELAAREIQLAEWQILFDHCARRR